MQLMKHEHHIIFDGVCNLCNGTVLFILKRDSKKRFMFTALQTHAGKEILSQSNIPPSNFSTVVYIKKGVTHLKSTAILNILKDLGWCWNLFYILIIIPPCIRDFIYDIIAKNRYNIFGRRESCMVPSAELRERFLL